MLSADEQQKRMAHLLGPDGPWSKKAFEEAEARLLGTPKLELVHVRHTVEPKICELCGRNFLRSADVPMKERARECGACPPRKTKFA